MPKKAYNPPKKLLVWSLQTTCVERAGEVRTPESGLVSAAGADLQAATIGQPCIWARFRAAI